jgi:hypothetical protein
MADHKGSPDLTRFTPHALAIAPATAIFLFRFALDQNQNALMPHQGRWPRLFFTCPNTDLKVQHWLEDDVDAPGNEYVAVTYPA